MSNMVIDLNYAKKQRESILSNDECNNNTNNQLERFVAPMSYIINLHVELGNLASNLYEDLKNKYMKEILLNDLVRILNRMSDIAIFLDIDLISTLEVNEDEIETENVDTILNALFNHVSMLIYKKEAARLKIKSRIIPLFAQLVQGLGLTLDDLKEYYLNNFK